MSKKRDFHRNAAAGVRTARDQTEALLLSRRAVTLGGLGLTASLIPSLGRAWDGPLMDVVEGSEDFVIASDAYIYGYPLVTMEMTRRVVTNVVKPEGTHAPMGTLIKLREYPNASFRDVTAPNADTLYTTAFFDVGDEPWVLSSPDMKGRYFLLPCLSGWTDVFQVPGSRTTGTQAQTFLITGPGWSGTVPTGMSQLKSPTAIVWMLGRIYCTGTPQDYAEVHALQDQFKLQPLSSWGKDYTPPPGKVDPTIDMKTPPPDQVDKMDAATFFARLAELLKDNPPGPCDYPMIHRLERVGFKVGQSFDLKDVPPDMRRAFERAAADGKAMVANLGKKAMGEGGKGWTYSTHGGAYGVDYMYRAAIAYGALGENLPQDAIYPSVSTDSEGKSLDGSSTYILHFDKGRLPPVDAFWSVTAYDTDGYFIPNALKRQAIGDRDKLQFNPDGSLDLHIQADSPGPDKEANWLPVAKAPFTLLMRLYSPKAEILDGSWTPPPVKRVK